MRHAIALEPQKSNALLDRAVRCQMPVMLEIAAVTRGATGGRLASADDRVLVIALNRSLESVPGGLIGRYVEVEIRSDHPHFFTSHVVDQGGAPGAMEIVVQRPVVVQAVQRRRLWRAGLAPSSKVTLDRRGPGGVGRLSATLLNLSADGMACRIARPPAQPLGIGEFIEATFELPEAPRPFRFAATVRNITDSGPGAMIVGVEFAIDQDDEATLAARQSLADWLYQRHDTQQPELNA